MISNPRVYARVQLAETAVGPIAVSVMVHSGTGEVVRVVVGAGQRGVGRDLAVPAGGVHGPWGWKRRRHLLCATPGDHRQRTPWGHGPPLNLFR